jgi:hypothetical protein
VNILSYIYDMSIIWCLFHSSTALMDLGLVKLRFTNHIQLNTQQSVGILCTWDRPITEASTREHTTLGTDRHRTRNASKQSAPNPLLGTPGHRDRHLYLYPEQKYCFNICFFHAFCTQNKQCYFKIKELGFSYSHLHYTW